MNVGEKVTHDLDIDTSVVHGVVTATDTTAQLTQVKWADGSGPTWHRTRSLRSLESADQ